jgi:hypothetical protein
MSIPAKSPSAWRQALATFWDGFTTPSKLAGFAFLGSILLSIATTLFLFNESSLSGSLGKYVPRSGLDGDAFATIEALRTGSNKPERPRLIILGPSTIAQAIGSTDILETEIFEQIGQDIDVVALTTALQSPLDQFALIDRALKTQTAESPRVIIAISQGMQRLRWTPEKILQEKQESRIGFRSDWEDAEITLLGGQAAKNYGFYAADNLRFVLLNGAVALTRFVFRAAPVRVLDQFSNGPIVQVERRHRDLIARQIRKGLSNQDDYFKQLQRLVNRVATVPNTRLVFLDETLSPELVSSQALEGEQTAIKQAFQNFANQNVIQLWNIVENAKIPMEDYHDDLHVSRGVAQEKIRIALIDQIAKLPKDELK